MAKATADIRSLARSYTKTALKTLVGIMQQRSAPAASRVSAAIALLDRGWGKPSQAIEMDLRQKPIEELTDAELTAIIRNADRTNLSA